VSDDYAELVADLRRAGTDPAHLPDPLLIAAADAIVALTARCTATEEERRRFHDAWWTAEGLVVVERNRADRWKAHAAALAAKLEEEGTTADQEFGEATGPDSWRAIVAAYRADVEQEERDG
jgi:hypothetical protein